MKKIIQHKERENCDLVSVIIPIYNPGEALKRCLDSVTRQTYPSLEIILINDGSTDGSDELCRSFAEADSRIIYISQSNSGVSASRNRGLEIAKGKYVCFVDSDDYVDANYVAVMAEKIIGTDADLVIQGLKRYKDNELNKVEACLASLIKVSDLTECLFDKIFYYCGPYCKLFRTSFVRSHRLSFPTDLSYGEDAVFYFNYLEHCRSILLLSDEGYNYQAFNNGSLSTKILPPDKFWQNQHNRRKAYRHLKACYSLPQTESSAELFCKRAGVAGMMNSIFKLKKSDAEARNYIKLMKEDEAFGLAEMRGGSFIQNLTLWLVNKNNAVSRRILKLIYA